MDSGGVGGGGDGSGAVVAEGSSWASTCFVNIDLAMRNQRVVAETVLLCSCCRLIE